MRRLAPIAGVASLALILGACGDDGESSQESPVAGGGGLSGELNGAGSSAMEAAMAAWRAGFQELNPDITVNYDPAGSGAGREQFAAGATDFGGSDAYLVDEELDKANERCGGQAINLPHYISPIAVAFNLDGIESLNLKPSTIAQIFDQQITTWDDPAIAEDNPDVDLPDTTITPVNRSDESGTTENFVEYLAAAAPDDWPYEVSGDWPVKGGEAAQGTSGVVAAITQGTGTIGYADASQVVGLGTVAVGVGEQFVPFSPEAAAAIVENSPKVEGRAEYDGAIELERDTTESGNYPVVLVAYHMLCMAYPDQDTLDKVKGFMEYVISEEGQDAAAAGAGSAPISDGLREQSQTALDAMTVG